jgi:hypothetical protein
MASIAASLEVESHHFRLLHCTFRISQAITSRGRATEKARCSPVELVLDVPAGDFLLAWAANPLKRVAVNIVFSNAATGSALETLSLPAAYCVAYQEQFVQGNAQEGAYQCSLTLADPDGFTLQPGGPTVATAIALPSTLSPPVSALVAVATATASSIPAVVPEYTPDEFKKSIWGADQVSPTVIEQLYQHFNTAKASPTPTSHWAAMETLVRGTTYVDRNSGLTAVLNAGWPPANGGVNKRLVSLVPPAVFDRYQKRVRVDEEGLPILEGTFTSPLPAQGAFDYEARALEGQETDYDLKYEIEVLKPLPFAGEEADIIPWHGHSGNGVQTKMLFPPKDPTTGEFPWSWKKLEEQEYIRVKYKESPSGKFEILPDNQLRLRA